MIHSEFTSFDIEIVEMACSVTAGSGQSKGLEDALGSSVKGKLQGKRCFVLVYIKINQYNYIGNITSNIVRKSVFVQII